MRDSAALFEPIVDVRDVVQSYLSNDVVVSDWQSVLADAAQRLSSFASLDTDIAGLARSLRTLVDAGLVTQPALVRSVADTVSKMLDQISTPTALRPADANWAF
jgi:hypothetical protein